MTFKRLCAALALALALMAPVSGQAQTQVTPPTQKVASFDGFRALAVTTGIIAGALVATVLTDGLIIPTYMAATGEAGVAAAGTAMAAEGGVAATVGPNLGASYSLLREGIRLFGAISGGIFADSLYLNSR